MLQQQHDSSPEPLDQSGVRMEANNMEEHPLDQENDSRRGNENEGEEQERIEDDEATEFK